MIKAVHRAIILGSGSSGGVPRPGGPDGLGDWGACDPNEPKNRRSRCSLLVQRFTDPADDTPSKATNLLIDTSPDMRNQLLDARCAHIDGVLYTHDHADQTHGLDDLRVFALRQRQRVPVYIDYDTAGILLTRFSYCFTQAPGSHYPPILDHRVMPDCGMTGSVEGPGGVQSFIPFLQYHGGVNSLGFRIGDIAYSSDVVGLPEESFAILEGVKLWIVDALQYKPHATHAHLDLALEWIERVKPERAVLTNMHVHLDYNTLKQQLPAHVEPAYDGLAIDIAAPSN